MSIFTDPIPEVFIIGSTFLFSGKFEYGEKIECCEAVSRAGGLIQNQVNGFLDYLVVGKLGNERWKYKTYGRKIETAIEMNKKCCTKIAIISEDTWLEALKKPQCRPLDKSGKRIDGYDPEEIYPIWKGKQNIRFTYSGYWDTDPAEVKEICLTEINVKPKNCVLFLGKYNITRIQDPIEFIDTGELCTVEEFVGKFINEKYNIIKHNPAKSSHFVPFVEINFSDTNTQNKSISFNETIKPFLQNIVESKLPENLTYIQTKELFRIMKSNRLLFSIEYSRSKLEYIIFPDEREEKIYTMEGNIYKKLKTELKELIEKQTGVFSKNEPIFIPHLVGKDIRPDFFTVQVPDIEIKDKTFLFCGKFQSGNTEEIEKATKQFSGKISKLVTHDLDYFIFGKDEYYKYKVNKTYKYPKELEDILKLNIEGANIPIIRECDWRRAIRRELILSNTAYPQWYDMPVSYASQVVNHGSMHEVTLENTVIPILEDILGSSLPKETTYEQTKDEFKFFLNGDYVISIYYTKIGLEYLKTVDKKIYNLKNKNNMNEISKHIIPLFFLN